MSNIAQLYALFYAVFLVSAQEFVLPPGTKVCNHTLPDWTTCLKNNLNEQWPLVAKGIPKLGLPSLDPVNIGPIEYDLGVEDVFSARLTVLNATTYGIANLVVSEVRAVRKDNRQTMEVDMRLLRTFTEGQYEVEGHVGLLKIGGKGYFNKIATNNRFTWRIDGTIANDRWVIEYSGIPDPVAVVLNTDNVKFYFEDLFNGNQFLNKAALFFINTYWRKVYLTMSPAIWEEFETVTTELSKLTFSRQSFSKKFP